MAIILGQRCFAPIFSTDIFGKKIVKNIPIIIAKIGWKESVNKTSDTGANMYANAKIIFPDTYKASFKRLKDKIALELFLIACKKFSRYERININITIPDTNNVKFSQKSDLTTFS